MAQKTQDPGPGGGGAKVVSIHESGNRPGALRGESWITIQTRQAQRLIGGRKREADVSPIIGLTQFGAIVSRLFTYARVDDPYAQWWLLKIEDALEGSAREIERLRQKVGARLKGSPGFEAKIAESLEAVRVPLKFANPYAYQAARLIVAFDDLMRAILTARHVGLMGREETEKTANLGGKAVRRALQSAVGYKAKMISRQHIEEGNAKALEAREVMGELPQGILDRTLQAKHAPAPIAGDLPDHFGSIGFSLPSGPQSGATNDKPKE